MMQAGYLKRNHLREVRLFVIGQEAGAEPVFVCLFFFQTTLELRFFFPFEFSEPKLNMNSFHLYPNCQES